MLHSHKTEYLVWFLIYGFNIAILTGVLLALSRPFLGHRWSAWCVLAGIALYTVLVGADAAVVRAAIMGALFVIAARLMGRPTFAPAGLFTAAIIMTAINPNILWDIGFQLSFAATLGLMLYIGPASDWTLTRLRPKIGSENAQKLTRMLAEILFATLAATIITLPIILYHFGQLSLISPLANLFVLPAQPGVMIWGGLAMLTGMTLPAVGQLFAWVAWLFLTWTISLVRLFASVPGAAVPVSISPLGIIVIYALLFGLTWYALKSPERREDIRGQIGEKAPQRLAIASLAVLALLAVAWAISQPDGYLHVSFLDVGQGDATLIQTPSGRQILIDGGAYPTVLNDQVGRQLPFWDRDIDIVIATHPDTDHVAGLPGVFDRYRVGALITNEQVSNAGAYEALLATAAADEVPIHHALAGEVIAVDDGVRLEILNPAGAQLMVDGHENNQSIAIRLVYSDFSLLLTGDSGEPAERAMIEEDWDMTSLVYKAGHHGAKSSSSKEFLRAIRPHYVIVSAGEGNRYGHPHKEMLRRVADVGAAVLRTDELGTIELISDGHALWWEADDE